MRKLLSLFCAVYLLGGTGFAAAAETIKIGLTGPMTGDSAQYGVSAMNAAEQFLKETNSQGGIGGKQVEVVYGDDKADPKEAAAVASKFAGDKSVVAIVGHFNSSCSLAGQPIYERAGMVELSYGSTNPVFAKQSPWSFRNVFEDTFQGKFAAGYTHDVLKINKVAVFYDNDDYGIGLKNSFITQAKAVGIEVVGEEAYTRDSTDFTPQLTKFRAGKPEAIFIAGLYTQGALIATQAKKLGGLKNVKILGADGLDSEEYIKIAQDAANGTYVTSPFLFEAGGPEAKKFAQAYKENYGAEPDWVAANAYDALGLLKHVIEQAGPDRQKIRDFMAGMTTPEKGYKGITGNTYFDANGDCQKPAYVKTVENRKWVAAKVQMK